MFKILVTDLDKLKQRLRSENGVGQLDHVVIVALSFVSGVVDRSRLVMRVCTPSVAIFHHIHSFPTFCNQLYSNVETLKAAVKMELIMEFLYNNSVV